MKPDNPAPVAAIVLNYNGKDVTLQALESLTAMNYLAYELVVVDNGSTDGSKEAIEAAYPEITVLRTEVNLGPTGACNLGVAWALERDFKYFLILNNDIEVDPSMLCHLVEVAESEESIGIVGPKAYYFWERERIWSAGGRIRFREAITRERGDGEIDRGQYDRDEEVDYINGCAMLVDRRVMEEVGPWDPLFHLAVEDADFCTRAKKQGYRCFFAHRARLWHMVSWAVGHYTPGRTFNTGRATALYVRRYARWWQWATSLFFMALSLPLAFLRELRRGNQRAVVAKARGFWVGFRTPMPSPPSLDDLVIEDAHV